jgi:hypothetical protein
MPLALPKPVVSEGQKLKLLVYADPGVGKTTLGATASEHPEMGPVLIANLEGGLLSVADLDGVFDVKIGSSADMEELYWNLKKGKEGYSQYKTLIIDSGTVFATRTLTEWTTRNRQRAIDKGKDVKDRTIDDVELQDYGKTGVQVRRLLSWFVDLPMHIVITALRKDVTAKPEKGMANEVLPILEIRPSFTDKLGNEIMGMVDHVWYMYTGADGVRYMLTERSGLYIAKTRGEEFVAALGSIVTDPNLADIYDTLLEVKGLKSGTKPAAASKGSKPSVDPIA